ncbi:hypothetical protein Asp14428_32850 [Actinoplanes sp. NBRC 14428]|nr:hypothetical protein Asp14428_32850 [Actinoplanes sp. NBRC 14428]
MVMRWMNRLATAMTVLAVVAGPPLLAGLWLLHHPWHPPSRTQILTWADQPLTAGTIIAGCIAIAGLVWLLLLTYLIHQGLTVLRRHLHRIRHLPVPTPAQMTASSMVGVAAFTLPTAPADPHPMPAVPGTPQHLDPADPGQLASDSAQDQPSGIALPGGGWIPNRTAAAITALVTAAWLQRRRTYRPDPYRPRDHRDDPDLQPLPHTVHTIITAATHNETTGPDRTTPPLLTSPLPAGLLLLTGPGAAAAARGLLVTATYHDTPTVRVQPRDLHTVLPAAHPANEAVDQAHTQTGEKCGSSADTVIALGDEPAALHRWHVTADGIATGTGLTQPYRLCTLDAQTAIDLIALTRPPSAPAPNTDQPLARISGRPPEPVPEPGPEKATAHLTLLGGCQLHAAGAPVHLRRTAGLQLLAYLAVHPERTTRDELTKAIWPNLPPASIRQRLHTTLTDLRRQLRPLLDDDPITRHDDHYRLNAQAITTDLQQWRTATHAMTHAVGTAAQLHACRNVANRYRGELAAGQTWPWLIPAREQTRRSVVDACTVLAEHTNPREALDWVRRAISIDPYNEPLHHRAADLLRATGDYNGAADLIKRLHHRLAVRHHVRL